MSGRRGLNRPVRAPQSTRAPTGYDAGRDCPITAALRRLRLPLIAALALAFVSLALISGIAYIVVLAGATNTAERLLVDRAGSVVEAQVAPIQSRLDPVTEHLELIAALAAARPARRQLAGRHARGAVGDDEPGAGDLERRLRHLRPAAGPRRPPARRRGDPRHRLAGRPAARPGALPRAADLAQHLLGRAVLERARRSSRCSTCARRYGASTTPSSAACSPPSRSATCPT